MRKKNIPSQAGAVFVIAAMIIVVAKFWMNGGPAGF